MATVVADNGGGTCEDGLADDDWLSEELQIDWEVLSDFVETKKYWTLPKSCGSQSSETKKYWTLPKSCDSQSSEREERKQMRIERGSLCARRNPRLTVTCHRLRVVEPVGHQAPLRGGWRGWTWSFAAGQAL